VAGGTNPSEVGCFHIAVTGIALTGLDEVLKAVVVEAVREALAEQSSTVVVEPHWLSVESAAVYLSMSPEAVRGAIRRGQLTPCRTPTGRVRFSREQLDRWVTGERDAS
jgi:excisionase family DNA binding protein